LERQAHKGTLSGILEAFHPSVLLLDTVLHNWVSNPQTSSPDLPQQALDQADNHAQFEFSNEHLNSPTDASSLPDQVWENADDHALLYLPTELAPIPPTDVTLPSEALDHIETLGISSQLPDWLIA
jgi:hypothetical protein